MNGTWESSVQKTRIVRDVEMIVAETENVNGTESELGPEIVIATVRRMVGETRIVNDEESASEHQS